MTAAIDDVLIPGQPVDKQRLRDYLRGREVAVPQSFGGIPDGVTDCSDAIEAALAASTTVLLVPGAYRTSRPVVLGYGQTLMGVGEGSVLQARPDPFDGAAPVYSQTAWNAVEVVDGYAAVRDLRIVGGATGIKLYGRDGPCVKTVVENVSIWDAVIGIVLDGYQSPDRPCYWNHVARTLIARPQLHGVLLTVETTGDTPNANKFHDVRVYSLSAPMSGCGFFLSAGRFNNSFVDCEANLHPGAEACLRLGFSTDQTLIVNFYAESLGPVPGIRIDGGSRNTSIVNLFSATGGAPIWDTTAARAYTAINSGFPVRNHLKRTDITEARIARLELETDFTEANSHVVLDPARVVHLVSAWTGPTTAELPDPHPLNGVAQVVKKSDIGPHAVTVTQAGGGGPDGGAVTLTNQGDHVVVVSNSAAWHIVAARYDRPVATWPNPSGASFTRGPFDADAITNVPFSYSRDAVNEINYRLQETRAILRALILDLKMAKVFR